MTTFIPLHLNDIHAAADMRHRFTTNTLVHWYQADQDPERLLPVPSPISDMCTSRTRSGI